MQLGLRPLALQRDGPGGPHGVTPLAKVENGDVHPGEYGPVDRGRAPPVGRMGLPDTAHSQFDPGVVGGADRPHVGCCRFGAQPGGCIVGPGGEGAVESRPFGHRERVENRGGERHFEVGIGAAQDVEVVQGLLVVALGNRPFVFGGAQPRLDHQHVAFGDVALFESPVDDFLERADDLHEPLHGGPVLSHGREVPVGVFGGVAHLEQGEGLVAEGRRVVEPRLAIARPDGSAAVEGPDDLGLQGEAPGLDALVLPQGDRKVARHREGGQERGAGLQLHLCRPVAFGPRGLQRPAVVLDGAAVFVQRGLRLRLCEREQQEKKDVTLHGSGEV